MGDEKKVGARSRRKGAGGEREVAQILRSYGYDAHRGMQAAGEPDVIGLPGVHIEVKRRQRIQITDWMEQSVRDALPGEIPIVMHRRDREPWLVTMSLEDFMILYGEWEWEREQ